MTPNDEGTGVQWEDLKDGGIYELVGSHLRLGYWRADHEKFHGLVYYAGQGRRIMTAARHADKGGIAVPVRLVSQIPEEFAGLSQKIRFLEELEQQTLGPTTHSNEA